MLALLFAARTRQLLGLLAALVLLSARIVAQGTSPTPAAPTLSDLKPLRVIDPHWIDTTVSACSDFFQYANGAWLAHDTIPAAYSSSGVTRDMSDRNEIVVRAVLDDAVARRPTLPPDGTSRKLGTFYASCMDSTAVEAAGPAPVRPWLAEVDSITARSLLVPEIAALHMRGVNVAFRYTPEADPHDAAHYLAWISQGGLGLPDRDYYTNAGASADSIRRQYVEHAAKLLRLAGQDSASATADAGQVMVLETALAQASLTRVQQRDPAQTDHPMSAAQLDTLAPRVPWPGRRSSAGSTPSSPRRRCRSGVPTSATMCSPRRRRGSPRRSRRKISPSAHASAAPGSCCRDGSAACARRTVNWVKHWARPTSPRRSLRRRAYGRA